MKKLTNKLAQFKQWILSIVIMRYYLMLLRLNQIRMNKEVRNAINGNRTKYDRLSLIGWNIAKKYDAIRDNAL